uniref:SSD domain-containing protein n=1 Tax=Rhabditophanes sp. KR3021 TaxID=114890 RepID=A0AC35U2Y9_9BILA
MSFDTLIHRLFFRWGLLVHNQKFIFLTFPIFLTIFLGYGFVWIGPQTTIDPQYVFSPSDAAWRYELNVLKEHWPLDENRFYPGKSYDLHGYVDVIVAARKDHNNNRPNILSSKYINELKKVNDFIIHNLTVPITHKGRSYNVAYTDLCLTFEWKCFLNDHIDVLLPRKVHLDGLKGEIRKLAESILTTEIKVTYPIGWRGTEPIYFGALIGAPKLTDDEGHFNYAKAVRLTYNTREKNVDNVSYIWRKQLADFLSQKNRLDGELLEFGLYHNESLPEGLQQVADSLTPKFVLMSTSLFVICMLCSIVVYKHNNGLYAIDWTRSKPAVGFAGIVCPLIATVSAWGLVLWTGDLYNAIVNISPFIVICIGIDDLFIMSTSWHRTNADLSTARRLAETLSEAAVAITITSATDMLTFGIGIYTTLPGVRLFCLYTFWGVTFTYIYQITFFAAVMAYAGELEANGTHSMIFKKAMKFDDADNLWKRLCLAGSVSREESHDQQTTTNNGVNFDSRASTTNDETISYQTSGYRARRKLGWTSTFSKFFLKFETPQDEGDEMRDSHHERDTLVSKFFREIYGPILIQPKNKKYVFFMYLAYILIALFGCSKVKEGLNPKNLVLGDFYLAKFYDLIEETFWEEGLQVQVVVNNPPNLFNQTERGYFDRLLNSFENTSYTMNHNATMLWLPSYEEKLKEDFEVLHLPLPNSTESWYHRAHDWLISAGGRKVYEKDMDWASSNDENAGYNKLLAFRFQIGLKNYRTPTDHTQSCQLMRKIAEEYSKFNVTTFHEYYPFADQYIELKPALIRNCLFAVMCMMAVSLIMIPHYGASYVLVIAIISIDIGVLGFMALWKINLESVSMITVIMSIGFAVDLSAHIVYAFVAAKGDANLKAITALETLGWPVFLGASTTILGIMTLAFVDAHIVRIFFKVTFLVITFSLMHGLIFIPTVLIIFLPTAHVENGSPSPSSIRSSKRSNQGVVPVSSPIPTITITESELPPANDALSIKSLDSHEFTEVNIDARLSDYCRAQINELTLEEEKSKETSWKDSSKSL